MATTVTGSATSTGRAEPTIDLRGIRGRGGGRGGRGGNGGPNGKGPGGGGRGDGWNPGRYRIGIFVGIASILMMFSALASAYIVRSGLPGQNLWQRTPVPSFAWISTGLILASSVTMFVAVRALRRSEKNLFRFWLGGTLAFGAGFLVSQLLAWREMVEQGVYLASNPHSSFFYVLTGLHGVHLFGGIAGLAYLLLFAFLKRSSETRGELKLRTLTDVVSIYWHFMDGLWVFLFLLLFVWR